MMNDGVFRRLNRRMMLKSALAMAGATAMASFPRQAEAHDLKPTDPAYPWARYEAILNKRAQVKQVYQWPNLTNAILYPNIRNGLNGAQFSYGIPADDIQIVVQAYFSANAAMYDDSLWSKFRLGEMFNVRDPSTGQPATRNIWYATRISASTVTPPPLARSHPYYADTSIEGLQRRGVGWLI